MMHSKEWECDGCGEYVSGDAQACSEPGCRRQQLCSECAVECPEREDVFCEKHIALKRDGFAAKEAA